MKRFPTNPKFKSHRDPSFRATLFAIITAVPASLLQAQIDLDFSSGVADGQAQQGTFINNDNSAKISPGDYFYFDNVGYDAATNTYIDARVSILDTNSKIRAVAGTAEDSLGIWVNGRRDGQQNAFVSFNLSFWESDGILGSLDASLDNAYTLESVSLQSFDIDRYGSGFTDIFGYSNDNAPDTTTLAADTLLDQNGFENTENFAVPDGFTTFSLQKDDEGNYLGTSVTTADPMGVQEDYAVTMEYSGFQQGDFIWGITGENSSNAGNRGMALNGSAEPIVHIVAPATPTPTFYAFTALLAGLYFKNRRNANRRED